MRRDKKNRVGDISPGSGALSPLLVSALAKAAAPGRASSERGEDFCLLHAPRYTEMISLQFVDDKG